MKQIYALVEEAFPSIANRDPVVRRGDKSRYPQKKIYPEAKIDCVARSRDKFILWINSASLEIKLNQRLSRVKSLWRCFFLMKHYKKQFSFSNKSHFVTRKGKYMYNKRNEMFIVNKSLHLLNCPTLVESLSKTKVKTSKHLCSIPRSTLNNELKSQIKPEVNFTLFRLGGGGGGV